MTLSDFLLARIAEDEESVNALLADGWTHDGSPSPSKDEPLARVRHWTLTLGRVLAECEAKRRIVEEHESYEGYGETCQTCHRWDDLTGDPWPCFTLRLLALPYADHPDYREEWKPDNDADRAPTTWHLNRDGRAACGASYPMLMSTTDLTKGIVAPDRPCPDCLKIQLGEES